MLSTMRSWCKTYWFRKLVYGAIEVPCLSTTSVLNNWPQLSIIEANFRPQSKLHALGTEPLHLAPATEQHALLTSARRSSNESHGHCLLVRCVRASPDNRAALSTCNLRRCLAHAHPQRLATPFIEQPTPEAAAERHEPASLPYSLVRPRSLSWHAILPLLPCTRHAQPQTSETCVIVQPTCMEAAYQARLQWVYAMMRNHYLQRTIASDSPSMFG
jgi:hypothetical protein